MLVVETHVNRKRLDPCHFISLFLLRNITLSEMEPRCGDLYQFYFPPLRFQFSVMILAFATEIQLSKPRDQYWHTTNT